MIRKLTSNPFLEEPKNEKKGTAASVEKKRFSNDFQLWQEFQTGSEQAYAEIYQQHVARLYSYGLKLVYNKEQVKDAIQDLFIELWNSKEKLAKVKSIRAYLFTAIRRKLITKATKERKSIDKSFDLNTLKTTTPSIEISLQEKQQKEKQLLAIHKLLSTLTQKQRELIHLKFYGQVNYDEIAEIMSLDKKAVYNLMARTIKLLKEQWQKATHDKLSH